MQKPRYLHSFVLVGIWHGHTNSLHYKYWLFVRDCTNSILILVYVTIRIATA